MKKENSGVGLVGVITIVFVILKLTNLINWSWWWVLSPIWIALLIALAVIVIALIGYVVIKRNAKK